MTTPAFNNAKLGNTVRTEHPAFYVNQSGIIFFDGSQQLTAFTGTANETDPVFSSSVAYNITISDTGNWTSAYSWGNHASAGYATTGELVSLSGYIQTQIDNLPADTNTFVNSITYNSTQRDIILTRNDGVLLTGTLDDVLHSGDNISLLNNDLSYITGYTETDPIFSQSVAYNISVLDTGNWAEAYSWGDHAVAGYATTGQLSSVSGYLQNQIDNITDIDTFTTGVVFNTVDKSLVLTRDGGSVTGDLSAVAISGDNISLLINDAGYITSGDLIPLSGHLSGAIHLNNYNILGTGNIFISGNIIAQSGYFDVISFSVDDESILTKGQISWDDTEGTMDIGLTDNTTIHIGEHRYYRVRNETGSVLYKGQVVYASGVHANGIIEPALYVANGDIREIRFMGLILENISNNSNGYAIDFGHLEDMDLDGSASNYAVGDETWVAGDILYVHPTVAGKLTKVEPKHSISVAIVLDPGNGNGNGRMFVRPTSYGHLNDNHDVDVSGLLNNQFLVYDSVTDYWQPSSGLYYVDGDLGIGTASPSYKLDVAGSGHFDDNISVGLDPLTNNFGLEIYKDKPHIIQRLSDPTGAIIHGNWYGNDEVRFATIAHYGPEYNAISAFNIGPSGSVFVSYVADIGIGTLSNDSLIFGTYNIERARINPAGNFGIGTDNPSAKLNVENGNVVFNDLGGNYDFRVEGDSDPNVLVIDASSDKVGIGGYPDDGKLTIDFINTNDSAKDAIYIHNICNSTSNGNYQNAGIDLLARKIVNSGVTDTGQIIGLDAVATLDGDGHLNNAYGARTWGGIYINQSGTLTNAWGIQPRVINAGYEGSLISDARGIDILIDGDLYNRMSSDGITNAKALYIRPIKDAANKYGIYQEGSSDDNYFAGHVGIGTASPSYKLDVNGTFSANSINVNDQFTFPTTDGSGNYGLVTDGSGNVDWQPVLIDTDLNTSIESENLIALTYNSSSGTLIIGIDASGVSSGKVITSNGNGSVSWQDQTGSGTQTSSSSYAMIHVFG